MKKKCCPHNLKNHKGQQHKLAVNIPNVQRKIIKSSLINWSCRCLCEGGDEKILIAIDCPLETMPTINKDEDKK